MSAILRRLCASRPFPWVAALLSVALVSPSLRAGWFLDDLWHRAGFVKARALTAYLGEDDVFRGPMRMYAFWDGDRGRTQRLMDRGIIPWWSDPTVRISFWRPLSVLTHAIDYRLWPERALWMHVQSVLWLGLLVGLAGLLYRRLFGIGWAGGLATLLFAVSEPHAMPAAWLANRHALVSGCFAVLALLAHVRWRTTLQRPWCLVAWVTFALALLASEAGVVALAYLCAYAVVLESGSWRARLASLLPYLAVVALWRAVYTSLGYGVVGSPLYVDPGASPLRFTLALLERGPILAVGLLGLPADLYMLLSPLANGLLAGGAVLTLLLLGWMTRPLWRGDRLCRFFASATLLAIVPLCAAMPGSRNLGLAALGAAGLVAQITANATERGAGVAHGIRFRAAWLAMLAVLAGRLVLAPLSLAATASFMARLGPGIERVIAVPPIDRGGLGRELMLVNPPSSLGIFFLVPDRLLKGLPLPDHTRVLASGAGPVEIERVSGQALTVRPRGGYCLPPGAALGGEPARHVSLDNVLRRAETFLCGEQRRVVAGTTVALSGVTVRVIAVTEDGRAQEVRFEFDVPLADASLRWLRWDAGRGAYAEWVPPAVGGRVTLE